MTRLVLPPSRIVTIREENRLFGRRDADGKGELLSELIGYRMVLSTGLAFVFDHKPTFDIDKPITVILEQP